MVLASINKDRAQLHPEWSESPNYRYITFHFCAIFKSMNSQVFKRPVLIYRRKVCVLFLAGLFKLTRFQ